MDGWCETYVDNGYRKKLTAISYSVSSKIRVSAHYLYIYWIKSVKNDAWKNIFAIFFNKIISYTILIEKFWECCKITQIYFF